MIAGIRVVCYRTNRMYLMTSLQQENISLRTTILIQTGREMFNILTFHRPVVSKITFTKDMGFGPSKIPC